MPAPKPPAPISGPVSDVLRSAIATSGRTATQLGIEYAVLARFEKGDGLPLSAVDSLCRRLGLELRQVDVPTPATVEPPARRGRPPVKRRPRVGAVA